MAQISKAEAHSSKKKGIGPLQLIALGVGTSLGSGLFAVSGIAAGQNSGPAVSISFILGAIACALVGLCYAELSTMFPKAAGASYAYISAALGECPAWLMTWCLVSSYILSISIVSVSWSGYLSAFLAKWHFYISPQILEPLGTTLTLSNGSHVLAYGVWPGILLISFVTLLLSVGTKESIGWNSFFVTLKVAVVLLFVICALPFISMAHYTPYIPANQGQFGHFGWSGVISGAVLVFFSYLGFDVVASAGVEARNPQRDLPIGILGALTTCAVLAVGFSGCLVGIVPYLDLGHDTSPLATAMAHLQMPFVAEFLNICILLGFSAGLYGIIFGQSRVLAYIAEDGLLPQIFAKKNKRQAPWVSILFLSLIGAVLAIFIPVKLLGGVASLSVLLTFSSVCLSLILLRIRRPEAIRTFQVPFGKWLIPGGGIVVCGVGLVTVEPKCWIYLGVWLLAGEAIYLLYGRKHSRARCPETL
ncbi:amino acid permease [Acetobacteraceae bacterium]|nr:amino acid permease [Acetobacteraceae bacterium]